MSYSFAFFNLPIGGSLGNGDVRLTAAAKEVTKTNTPAGGGADCSGHGPA